jgi:hypothetical protein
MLKTRMSARSSGRAVPVVALSTSQRQTTLAPYQTRTCVRCGRHTTFVLDDPAGGWYACIECGRYA